MPNLVYDTRFLIEHFYSANETVKEKTKREILNNKAKHISVITLHEIHRLSLGKEGHKTAQLRTNLTSKDFEVVEVNSAIAIKAAEIRHGLSLPMADSLIAATRLLLKATCVSDDPHLAEVQQLSTRWIQ